ncbi:hypothetical protein MGYG_07294 [Nannizzia gypsea CBS 118893]|uniref:Zn(2)-C6 fungal-type domain-containing protein n=1 Tax=Arthroderma gypseum (strain ATCC MYA-4604 / CBS 118893) TaxID=535722 RepID=E4V2M0_ARTGP|nr:hypothetical protein MGYG_07294 [Nannizzia gypsea CBS 118893]EFR04285.1 hypothetical protein MGYG_07294 [Nannizzia gypsea CBS 118893]
MASDHTNDDSKYMFGSQPNIRNACDACHKRKIRCMVSRNGGPCYNCKSRGLSCYFLPRYRSGRPRRRDNSSPETIETITPTPTPTPPSTNNSFWPGAQKAVTSSTRKSPTVVDQNNDLLGWVSDQDFTAQIEEHGSDLRVSGQPLRLPGAIDGPFMEPEQTAFPNFTDPSCQPFSDIQPDDLVTLPPLPNIQTPSWSPAFRQPSDRSNYRNGISGEGGFTSLLEQCSRLQRHLTLTEKEGPAGSGETGLPTQKKNDMSDNQVQEILEDVDASCKLMLEMCDEGGLFKSASAQVNNLLDSASISLIITAVFKVFQICDVLFSGQVLRVHSMKDILRQKRLDFNITQARIVTARIEQLTQSRPLISQELSKRAVYIEERFTSQRGRSSAEMDGSPET